MKLGFGSRLNRLDEPVFIAVQKLLLCEFGIHHGLTSYGLTLVSADENEDEPGIRGQ